MARCVADEWPPGCRGGWEGLLPRHRARLRLEEAGRYCVVYEPLKAVLVSEACEWLKRIAEGRGDNLLLLGPPGTGKSLFMRIASMVSPMSVYNVEPEAILSSLVGESEKRFARLLDEAEASAPSLILFDEADLLIARRSFRFHESGYGEIRENLIRMLLRRMQKWRDEGTPVYIIASTNMPLAAVDTALIRAHRFRTIFFPVPDVEAVKLLYRLYGREPPDDRKIEEVIKRAPSYANIVDYILTGRLSEFQLSPFMKILSVHVSVECELERGRTYLVAEEHPLAAVVAALHSAIVYRKPVILLLEPARYEDAVWLSRSMGWPLAIPYSAMIVDNIYSIIYRAETVYLLGSEWRIHARLLSVKMLGMACSESRLKRALGCKEPSIVDCLYALSEKM